MQPSFFELFFFCFLLIAASYGLLASWTSIFYRKKAVGQLRGNELRVKQGTASIDNRLSVLARTFFLSFFTYQVYLLALALSGGIYLIYQLAGR
ncbi:hypothetical protein [Desulfopila aestuarii]|uniref:Uncharacterized protein n=1 Tax=Desulfopila aestuarii DSM 18488 TaxID=1121416 RepID=A0A1M7Y007_9BACT|nr:hypothetical protein [Desulfopila aestuarii]SHO44804.1 hypothetical protein SAMN02745220_00881 [Desulfopila aestuarii DSM 18488]